MERHKACTHQTVEESVNSLIVTLINESSHTGVEEFIYEPGNQEPVRLCPMGTSGSMKELEIPVQQVVSIF
jgi:hypothetical protein